MEDFSEEFIAIEVVILNFDRRSGPTLSVNYSLPLGKHLIGGVIDLKDILI
jgi:hypothetical protein